MTLRRITGRGRRDEVSAAMLAPIMSPGDLAADLWLRSDLGVTLASGRVSLWANQGTGTNLDHSQGTATRRPNFLATDPNFNARESIDKVDASEEERLDTTVASTSLDVPDGGDLSILVVGSTAEDDANFLVYRSLAWPGNGFEVVIGTGFGGQCQLNLRDVEGAGTIIPDVNPNPAVDKVVAYFGECIGAVTASLDSAMVTIDGTSGAPFTGDLQTIQGSGTFRLFIGPRDGNVGEVAIWTRLLTIGEKQSLAAYVANLWAVTIGGPIG